MSHFHNPFLLSSVSPLFRGPLRRITGLSTLARHYHKWRASDGPHDRDRFIAHSLQIIGAEISVDGAAHLHTVPRQGPLIVVANHPLGGLEGLILSQILLQVRPDLKVLTNRLLCQIPELRELFIGIDNIGGQHQLPNARSLRVVSRHLDHGGAILMFPAGTVSSWNWRHGCLEDQPWNRLAGHYAKRSNATCLPIHVEGRNSRSFYACGKISKMLRTAMLARAMMGQRGKHIGVRIGAPFTIDPNLDATTATTYLRLASELLQHPAPPDTGRPEQGRTLISATSQEDLKQQIQRLQHRHLHRQGDFGIYCARWQEMGCLARHLSREREHTFRQVGEGTGKERDEDRFDHSHQHLFVWDHRKHRLVGAYRIAVVADLVAQYGLAGLYSHSLFHYDRTLLESLGSSVEVGRSFVTGPYQANPRALDMLWLGIGRFMVAHPPCHTLFGCVSISADYAPVVRSLLADSLLTHYRWPQTTQVRPRHPHRHRYAWINNLSTCLTNISAINKLLGQVDAPWRVPVLIRHYLSLNGRLIDFTINKGFNQALDGLIVVDLRQTRERYLRRYMGDDGFQSFRRTWPIRNDPAISSTTSASLIGDGGLESLLHNAR